MGIRRTSNHMIKNKYLCILLIAGLALTACSSDDAVVEQKTLEPGKTYYLTVDATKGSDATTRALTLSGSTLTPTWATSEHVYVKGSTWATGSLSPDANAATARLNGVITGITGVLPQDLTLQFPRQAWSYTGQVGTIADIAAKYDYATATAHITAINGSNISASSAVTFTNQQAIVKFTLQDNNNGNAAINATSLCISANGLKTTDTETGDITITPASATSEIFAALRDISSTNVTLTAVAGGKTYVYNKSGASFTNGKYYEITVKMHEATEGTDLANVTTDYIGWVVGQNGKVYSTAAKASAASTTAVAMVAYVGTASNYTHGLAIALADESTDMNQSSAITAASTTKNTNTAVANATWRLPTLVDWQYILIGCGNGATYSSTPGTVGIGTLNAKLASVGNILQNTYYWSSIDTYSPYFSGNNVNLAFTGDAQLSHNVRACLAF